MYNCIFLCYTYSIKAQDRQFQRLESEHNVQAIRRQQSDSGLNAYAFGCLLSIQFLRFERRNDENWLKN